jgi:hypothetical protein
VRLVLLLRAVPDLMAVAGRCRTGWAS